MIVVYVTRAFVMFILGMLLGFWLGTQVAACVYRRGRYKDDQTEQEEV